MLREYPVTRGSHPHDVAVAADGRVYYTGQGNGTLGWIDPASGKEETLPLGPGAAPHGVISGPDGAAWITEGGQNAIARFDPKSGDLRLWKLPATAANANLNTAAFDGSGTLWFTGQNGFYGRYHPGSDSVEAFAAPRGRGPYGICATPGGEIYYCSLAGSHIAKVNLDSGEATIIEPPTKGQGARRVWSDSRGRIWVAEWNSGQVSVYDPAAREPWRQWKLPGANPQTYAVYVDELDMVWLTDFGANALVRFDPATERFLSLPLPKPGAAVRQLLGRPGEVWGAESSADALVVANT